MVCYMVTCLDGFPALARSARGFALLAAALTLAARPLGRRAARL